MAIVIINQSSAAQEDNVAGELFFVELGGPGAIISLNFDSRFNSNERLGLGYRLGAGLGYKEQWKYYYNYIDVTRTYFSFPAGVNYVFGKPYSEKTFEVGAGITFLSRKIPLYYHGINEKPGNFIGSLIFMYRVMPVNGGYSFRVGFTPIIGTGGDMYPMMAISFGHAYNKESKNRK